MKQMAMIFSLGLLIATAEGAQIKTVRNYEDIFINASIKEPNNLMLEDDRVQQIKAPGNTLVDACNGKVNCKLIDDTTGILTFLPSPLYHTRAFTINLLTEKGFFYNVRVEPKPIASQTIVFKSYKNPVIRARDPRTSSYEKVMVGFLRALVNGYLPEGFTQTIPKKPSVYKAQKTQLKRLLTVKGNRMRGEIFELKNVTNQPIDAKESWFNWPGTKGVALAKTHLAPLETTRLYRIS
ncbi:TPA: type-F conjugative transfer system secretin TraK [Legionella pneumophila]|nr:type-F conjugative transfer system secretin TraK [Legionella pneumophila]HCJ1112887.1 type-F conjugative transfer system secretin TraK [Legionella pneumophila]